MVLPFVLGAMAVGGAVSAIGATMQARATNRGIEKANSIPLVEKSDLNLDVLVEESQRAGFNPLTVLRAGGVAGYATHTTTGHNAHLFAQRQSPGGAFLSGIGNTISNVATAGLQHLQHGQSLAANRQIAAMSTLPAFGGVAYGGTGRGPAYGGVGRSGELGISSRDRWFEEVPGVTNPFSSEWWYSNPNWSDVETGGEARYGDLMALPIGAATIGADIGYTLARNFDQHFGVDPRTIGPGAIAAVRDWLTHGGNWGSLAGGGAGTSITVYADPSIQPQ